MTSPRPFADIVFQSLSASGITCARDELAALLKTCVDNGASVGYLAPLSLADAVEFWTSIAPGVDSGARTVIVARQGAVGSIVGSAQLAYESKPNGRHRAEVCKVLVLPSHRRRGIAGQLMNELERHARERAIRLLFLDTSEGLGGAQHFYERLGYKYAGGIPDYALDPDGRPAKNAIYYKLLA